MAIPDWSLPVLVSADIRQGLADDRRVADLFFLVEFKRVKKVYRDTGDPRLSYLCGKGVADLGEELGTRGSVGLGLLHSLLAEVLIASGTDTSELDRAEAHLIEARNQLERSPHNREVTRILGEWHMLFSITHKARGNIAVYMDSLDEGVNDPWLIEHGTPGDRVPIMRQQIMMRQDLHAHLALIMDAHRYKTERPLEYYRTLKRGVEFLSNRGMVDSVSYLKRDFVESFGLAKSEISLIGQISFAKNVAHIAALEGNRNEALRAATAALGRAQAVGLAGQIRQLGKLLRAIEGDNLRGALETYLVR